MLLVRLTLHSSELAEERSIRYRNINILKSEQRKAGITKYLSPKVISWVMSLVDRLDANDYDDGMIHCTGGAQTKVIKFIENKKVVKDMLFPIPPLFRMIEKESGTPRREMYEVFNMCHRLEVYCDVKTAQEVIDISKSFDIDAQVIGRVEDSDKNEVLITDELGSYSFN